MKSEHEEILRDCIAKSLAGKQSFPETLARLAAVGVERYHADYSRQEVTYYLADDDSLVVPAPHEAHPIATEFSAKEVAASVGRSQRGEHTYDDFVRETRAGGCVGYFVQLTGRRVIYFGRTGEQHVERFPGAKP